MQTKNTVKRIVGGGLAAATLAGVGVAATAPAASANVWDRLAECESNGNWSINTGNGYYGGLQFSQQSWNAAGGSGSPANASKGEQIRVAQNLHSMQGWGAWPSCSAQLGLHGQSPSAGATSEGSNTGASQQESQQQESAPQQQEQEASQQEESAPQEQAPAPQQQEQEQEAPQQ
ncbi:MAG: transglycosylase family protein, partial [Nesterenkonia sp.]|nr:transglycosylase family protein [Nesterenkonia sp.]